MSEAVANSPRLDQPAKRTMGRKLRALIWTIGITAVLFAGFFLWIEYRKFREAEFLVDIKNAGVSFQSTPVPYAWMRPFITDNTESFIESISPLEYEANLSGHNATRDAIHKALTLPNLVTFSLVSCQSLDDETVAAITRVPSLRRLALHASKIPESCISLIAEMQQLELLSIDQVAISERSLARLQKMSQLKHLILGRNRLDLFEGFRFEITGPNESKTIKVGDMVTFTGTFQTAKIIPATVGLACVEFDGGGRVLSLTGPVTQLKDGTFQFALKAPKKIEYAGSHKVFLGFQTAGTPRIDFTVLTKEFNVPDIAEPTPNASESPDPKKIEGKVEIKESPNPK
jgi:hypothetical protein